MKNEKPRNQNGVLALLAAMHAGAVEHGETTGLSHVTAALLLATRTAAVLARDALESGKQLLRERRDALSEAMEEARVFIALSRDVLKPIFGNQYNERWAITGFAGSLAVPITFEDINALLESLKTFFAANPTLVLDPRVTSAQAQTLFEALSNARHALELQRTVVDDLMTERDAKFAAASKVMTNLISELGTVLEPLDARWLSFGLNKPGALETPDTVTDVVATLIGPTAAALKWTTTARAEFYHVWKRVEGVDEDYVLVGSPADLDFTIENLPTNARIDVCVSAVNNGGEGPRSEAVAVLTHA